MVETNITKLLEQKFEEPDFQDCFIIDIEIKGNSRLEIYLDSDTALPFSKCQKISRYLEAFIDKEQWLGEAYTLEVSSPGVRRPLMFSRQYPKHVGRKLEVKKTDGEKMTGILTKVSESAITIEWKERIKEGKKKKNIEIVKEVPFDQIEKAIVKISFNK